jgi:hypothetical protein
MFDFPHGRETNPAVKAGIAGLGSVTKPERKVNFEVNIV